VISDDQFKSFMGSFASGVTVVTARDPAGQPCGITVSAFCSVSLHPPLGVICIDRRAAVHPALAASTAFAVNILSDGQQDVSNLFASRAPDKFAAIRWTAGPATGCPLFPDALASAELAVTQRVPAGDHDLLIGELRSVEVRAGQPLLYWRGGYCDLTTRAARG
jgi:flavin reductase (DIM6/NTAB) family NADH-FMN oxidoreductase RutF